MWRWLQLPLLAAVELVHESAEVSSEGSINFTWPQSYMRRERDESSDLFRLRLLPASESSKRTESAIVSHFCDASWAPSALALAASLRRAGTKYNLVVMITSDVDSRYQRLLSHVFDKVYIEEPVTPHASITRSGADCVTLQLRAWQLPYRKVLYVDADMIALRSHDGLLELDELAARKDQGLNDQFNGGMFLLQPSFEQFQKLRQLLSKTAPRSRGYGGIQYFLNNAFPRCQQRSEEAVGCWKEDFGDEFNKFTRNVDAAALREQRYASLHYSGDWGASRKPWMSDCRRVSDSVSHDPGLQSELLHIWREAFQSISAPADLEDLLHIACPDG